MKIYKKCPCCGKTIFLMLGSDFGNEIQLASGFGNKDNMPHQDTNHTEDYHCLNKFLQCLTNSHGQVFLSITNQDEAKIPEEFQELILNWTEKGYQPKEDKKSSGGTNPSDNTQSNQDWTNIHSDFDEDDIERWTKSNFTYDQTREWINAGFRPIDAYFCAWIRDEKKKTAEWCLNYGNINQLREEWESTFDHYE